MTTVTTGATLTVSEAAKLLRVSEKTVYRGVANGGIPALRFSRRILIPRAAIERLLRGERLD